MGVFPGTCRTSFHPICAREARHRMEVWGRYGCDNVSLLISFLLVEFFCCYYLLAVTVDVIVMS